ncbi:cation-transporting P-type ATPase [Haliea sp. E1-2-M8]|uniref:cation-transporting P-type ATPase n=1 Tax=Haliea sp. E1-2-M8 TaxID=3064706 RepID=UPI002726451F|nr:cation-transporting P-type ATPase [Haliea sp. E1-2-M8]MDO8863548.1 cation-transporting P-type ATPase [Haliea sp. E1-2-M8]
MSERHWHTLSTTELEQRLQVDASAGLHPQEAAERLARHGPNQLAVSGLRPMWGIILEQFRDFMILVLLAAALRAMAAPVAVVRRGGEVVELPATELVTGDLVLLEAGSLVPADLRLLQAADLQVDESMSTGESTAVLKHVQPLPEPDLPVAERAANADAAYRHQPGRGCNPGGPASGHQRRAGVGCPEHGAQASAGAESASR